MNLVFNFLFVSKKLTVLVNGKRNLLLGWFAKHMHIERFNKFSP